jgi:hypothetical protein
MNPDEIEKALQDAGIAPGAWRNRKQGGAAETAIDLLKRLEAVIGQQIEADKAQVTDLQIRLQRLEAKRG